MTSQTNSRISFWGGIGFTALLALLGFILAELPVFDYIGPLACSILLAIVYRNVRSYPENLRSGVHFSARILLRAAIILYGLKLDMQIIFSEGLGLLGKAFVVIVFSITVMMLLGRWLKVDPHISFLLGAGTGICGAAAIAAISPILQSEEEDTAMSVGMIALIGTVFAVGYTVLLPMVGLTPVGYGIWSGLSLHELAHVALAAEPAGEEAVAMALLAKLCRVFLLIPFSFLLVFWMKSRQKHGDKNTKIAFPWFLLGFVALSIFRTYIAGDWFPISLYDSIAMLTTFLLSMAMAGLGLTIDLRELKEKAGMPLLALVVTSILLSLITYIWA
ncbi:membrane protein [Bacillus sp. FJAT-27916]|uniref:YeiH family protein n=1 Tax=Bacillaceae TaxID=186817 RepID=UPI000670D4D9|nr:putative sulfate exporter family transporter [Bacillus sp. FJAT-27916]KMY42894.1 membrane protein [Bacillus sp. FJAT-27916]